MATPDPEPTTSSDDVKKCLKMVCGTFYIPKGKHMKPQGDDAHFVCVERQTIGVADGVGGWANSGVDAGEYARQLMMNASEAIHDPSIPNSDDPRNILVEAYSRTNVRGSSTALILALKNNDLHAANIGDSGFLLIREGEETYKSPIQQHHFNCPYQLGRANDRPKSAEVFKMEMKPGDLIIVGTDGLFDNLYPRNIEDIAKLVILSGGDPEQAAWAIAEHAYYNSVDETAVTPFTEDSWMAGKEYVGGKKDDITVIVAQIID